MTICWLDYLFLCILLVDIDRIIFLCWLTFYRNCFLALFLGMEKGCFAFTAHIVLSLNSLFFVRVSKLTELNKFYALKVEYSYITSAKKNFIPFRSVFHSCGKAGNIRYDVFVSRSLINCKCICKCAKIKVKKEIGLSFIRASRIIWLTTSKYLNILSNGVVSGNINAPKSMCFTRVCSIKTYS